MFTSTGHFSGYTVCSLITVFDQMERNVYENFNEDNGAVVCVEFRSSNDCLQQFSEWYRKHGF